MCIFFIVSSPGALSLKVWKVMHVSIILIGLSKGQAGGSLEISIIGKGVAISGWSIWNWFVS